MKFLTTKKIMFGVVLATVLYLAIILIAPLLVPLPDTRKPVAPIPAELKITNERVTFPSAQSDLNLVAWWMPNPEPKAVVVLVHGHGGQRTMEVFGGMQLAKNMLDAGYAVLSVDLRGHGESDDAPGGKLEPANLVFDVMGAIDWVKQKHPELAVGVIGASLGGATIVMAGVQDKRIEAVIAVAPALEPEASIERYLVHVMSLPKSVARHLAWSMVNVHGQLGSVDPLEVGAQLDGSKLFLIHNEADPINPVSGSRKLKAILPAAQLWITPPAPDNPVVLARGAWGSHVRSYLLHPKEFAEKTVEFLDARLTK
ncbi:MAG: alpha/beta fold hydrolase [Pseudomonadales bacterium]|nr:alpha/beta fold hydrolase [Pseudomonadales bacterium]